MPETVDHVLRMFTAEYMLDSSGLVRNEGLLVDSSGRIVAVGREAVLDAGHEGRILEHRHFDGHLLVPGLVNTHSHSFQVFLAGATVRPDDFDDWVARRLYPLVELLDEEHVYLAALTAFTRMLLSGTTTVGEFHYLHNGPDGAPLDNVYERAVIRAARDCGIRIALLRGMYDQGGSRAQARFQEEPPTAVTRTRELAQEFAAEPAVHVLPAPHSLHGASAEMIRAGSDLAEELDTLFHIHLAERKSDVDGARSRYDQRPLEALHELGVLSRRTVAVHGVWLSDEEVDMLGECDGKLAYNPLTNMVLGDGIAPLTELVGAGVTVSLGTDANTRSDLFSEMRTAELLQRIRHGKMGVLGGVFKDRTGARTLFRMATRNGGINLDMPVGMWEPGCFADFAVLSLDAPSMLPGALQGRLGILHALLHSVVPEAAVHHVYVSGEPVVEDGKPLNVDLEGLRLDLRRAAQRLFAAPNDEE